MLESERRKSYEVVCMSGEFSCGVSNLHDRVFVVQQRPRIILGKE